MTQQKNEDIWSKVLPYAQILTAILFIILPMIGFYGGLKYQQEKDQLKIQQITPTPQIKSLEDLKKWCDKYH